MQIGGVAFLIHELNANFHRCVLLVLLRHRRVVVELRPINLLLLVVDRLFAQIDIRDQIHQFRVDLINLLFHALLRFLRFVSLLLSVFQLGLVFLHIIPEFGNSGSRNRIYH